VPFKIPRAVLALPIWLIDRLRIDERTSRARPLVVRIDIIHIHEEARIRDVRGQRGMEPMFRRHAVKPNRGVTRTDLAMDGLTFRVSMHSPAIEAEGMDEEIVSRWDVLVSQNRNDSLEMNHDVLLLSHVRLTLRAEPWRTHDRPDQSKGGSRSASTRTRIDRAAPGVFEIRPRRSSVTIMLCTDGGVT
jgi:hypothetical protein